MEISLHLKPIAVCRLIYCRLSHDCQLSAYQKEPPIRSEVGI